MDTQPYRSEVENASKLLLALHRMLIGAARRMYEAEHGPIGDSYALLQQLMTNPAFAWLRPLTSLLTDVDCLLERSQVSAADAATVRLEAMRLLAPVDGGDAEFYRHLIDARAYAPDLVVEQAHVRAALAALPEADAAVAAAAPETRVAWRQREAT